ncbi:hypothetical protein [Gluconobacter sp.]|uniref:hypothetical protein n=1 Tax=Gluconobacter sp. TaxID=1876758 RepID=UPI0039E9C655
MTLWLLEPAMSYGDPTTYFMPPKAKEVLPMPSELSIKAGFQDFRGVIEKKRRDITPKAQWLPSDLSQLSKIGPLDIERATQSPLIEEKGITTTFSYPVKSLPGVDLTASFFGGHRDTIQGAAGGSAAVTGGVRIHW